MKTIYKSIMLCMLSLAIIAGADAQNIAKNDTTLNRQILLERDFNPTLQDASKINTLPAIHEPLVKQANVQFEERQPSLNFSNYPLGDTGSGDIKTAIGFNKKRGYFSLGAGNYANFEGKAGYRIVDSADGEFDLFARYNSTNGKIKYADQDYSLQDAKAKYNNMLIAARFQHSFSTSSVWRLNGGYENIAFNYYGNPFETTAFDLNSQQSVGIVNLETGFKSMIEYLLNYDVFLKFDHFSTKRGPVSSDKGVSGSILDGGVRLLAAPFNGGNQVGLNLQFHNQSFSKPAFATSESAFHSLFKISANPHFDIDGDNFFVSLGLTANYVADLENKFLMAPNIDFLWQFVDKASFYANVTGKINENTYLQTLQENRYFDPSCKVNYSRTIFDGTVGFKSGVIDGVEFNLSGGYKQTNDEHLYTVTSSGSWANVSKAEYVNLGTGHFSGLIKTNLIPYTDLSAKLTGYFYSVDGNDYDGATREFNAWNLPSMTFGLNADVKPIENLILSAGYELSAGREASFNNDIRKMKDINELNLGGAYQIMDWVSVNIKLNNVLNQKYESWYGYTHQGFNAMAGISLKF